MRELLEWEPPHRRDVRIVRQRGFFVGVDEEAHFGSLAVRSAVELAYDDAAQPRLLAQLTERGGFPLLTGFHATTRQRPELVEIPHHEDSVAPQNRRRRARAICDPYRDLFPRAGEQVGVFDVECVQHGMHRPHPSVEAHPTGAVAIDGSVLFDDRASRGQPERIEDPHEVDRGITDGNFLEVDDRNRVRQQDVFHTEIAMDEHRFERDVA